MKNLAHNSFNVACLLMQSSSCIVSVIGRRLMELVNRFFDQSSANCLLRAAENRFKPVFFSFQITVTNNHFPCNCGVLILINSPIGNSPKFLAKNKSVTNLMSAPSLLFLKFVRAGVRTWDLFYFHLFSLHLAALENTRLLLPPWRQVFQYSYLLNWPRCMLST